MRTIEVTLYQFDELTEDAQDTAIERLSCINVDHDDWWDFIYEDATRIGIEITEFDPLRGTIDGKLTETVGEVVRSIMGDHGTNTDTRSTAINYYQRKHDGNAMDEDEFLKLILEDYLSMLRREYDYMISREAIIESIEANEYEFDENGVIQ